MSSVMGRALGLPVLGKVWTGSCRQSLLVLGLDEGFDPCAVPVGKPTSFSLQFPICN